MPIGWQLVNNSGVVSFKADLDSFDTFDNVSGLFSGQDGKQANITTHYLSSNSQFSEFGTLPGPSGSELCAKVLIYGQATHGRRVQAQSGSASYKAVDHRGEHLALQTAQGRALAHV